MLLSNDGGNDWAGGTTINDGTLRLGSANPLPLATQLNININGTLDVNGQNVATAAGALSGGGTITNNAATTATFTFGADNASQTFSGLITNSPLNLLNIVKVGTGTQTLSGANSTYTGSTTVQNGALVVSGTSNGTSSVDVGGVDPATLTAMGTLTSATFDIHTSGRLDGRGNLNGVVTIEGGGTLAPTAGPTSLAINSGSLTFQSGSTFELSLGNSNGSGQPLAGDYAKLELSTGVSANLNGIVVATSSNPLNALDVFTVILSGAPVNGIFTNTTLVNGSTYALDSGGYMFEINYAFDATTFDGSLASFENNTGGTNVAILYVPEPNALLLLAGSLGFGVGLLRFRRRRI